MHINNSDLKRHFTQIVLLLTSVIYLSSCNNSEDQYQNGYEAAWDGITPSSWSNNKFREGYEQGLDDAYIYDEGYFDGKNGKRPRYFKDPDYMDGYKDGKRNK